MIETMGDNAEQKHLGRLRDYYTAKFDISTALQCPRETRRSATCEQPVNFKGADSLNT